MTLYVGGVQKSNILTLLCSYQATIEKEKVYSILYIPYRHKIDYIMLMQPYHHTQMSILDYSAKT